MRIEHHVYHHHDEQVAQLLRQLLSKVETIMATLDQVLDDVTNESTQIDGVLTLISGLRDQIAALPGIPPDQQAKIDQIFAQAETNKNKLATALAANTPQAAAAPSAAPSAPGT